MDKTFAIWDKDKQEYYRTWNGKHVWGSKGAAKNACIQHCSHRWSDEWCGISFNEQDIFEIHQCELKLVRVL